MCYVRVCGMSGGCPYGLLLSLNSEVALDGLNRWREGQSLPYAPSPALF